MHFSTAPCSPSHAERPAPAGGQRCLHRFPLERGCRAAAAAAARAPLPGEWRRPARSRTGSAADTDASASSDAAGN